MEKFADIIANRVIEGIKGFQQELDADFFNQVDKMNETYDTTISPLNQETLDDATETLLEQLEDNLRIAIEEENYELAAELQQKIKDLKK